MAIYLGIGYQGYEGKAGTGAGAEARARYFNKVKAGIRAGPRSSIIAPGSIQALYLRINSNFLYSN